MGFAIFSCAVFSSDSCLAFSRLCSATSNLVLAYSEAAFAVTYVSCAAGAGASVLVFAEALAPCAADAPPLVPFVAAADTALQDCDAGVRLKQRQKDLLDFAACLHIYVTTG